MAKTTILQSIFLLTVLALLSGCHSQHQTTPITANKVAARAKAQRVFTYLHQGYTDKAYEQMQAALYLAPDDAVVLDTAAYYYEKTGRLDIANRYYKQAIQEAPLSGITKNNYGAFLCRNGWYKQSLPYFTEAVRAKYTTINGEAYKNWQYCKLKMQTGLGSRPTSAYDTHSNTE